MQSIDIYKTSCSILEWNQSLYENKHEKTQKISTLQWPEHSLGTWQRAGSKFLLCQTHGGFNWHLLYAQLGLPMFPKAQGEATFQNFPKSSQKQLQVCKKFQFWQTLWIKMTNTFLNTSHLFLFCHMKLRWSCHLPENESEVQVWSICYQIKLSK